MSFVNRLRTGGTSDADIRDLQMRMARAEAEDGIEDTDEIRQGRVDYDEIGMSMPPTEQKMVLDGDIHRDDFMGMQAFADGGQHLRSPKFRMAGADVTSFYILNAPSGAPAKTSDIYAGEGGFSNSEKIIMGFWSFRQAP